MRICLEAGEVDCASRLAARMGSRLLASLKSELLLGQNRIDDALSVIERAIPAATNPPSLESVRLGVVRTVALSLQGDDAQALLSLKQVLVMAEPENRLTTFVRQGTAMEKLLRQALGKGIAPQYVRRILAAFEMQRKPSEPPVAESLVDALSERELEILQYLNGPLSTPEIAEQLVVSSNTVRTHVKNIYGKLGVHGRSGAVRRAKELGLLA